MLRMIAAEFDTSGSLSTRWFHGLFFGKIVQRVRPRYNSEYVWNRESLDAVGGRATDYHTKVLWIIEP